MHRMLSLAAAFFALAPLAAPVRAQSVPQILNFQGRLAKSDGTPVADVASQSLTFRLYTASTGGTAIWAQASNVAVRNGVFAARLDFSTGYQNGGAFASAFSGSPLYLETQVGSNAPLTPRQQLTSNAYAFTAQIANSVVPGSITGASIAGGTITADKFAPNVFSSLVWLLGGNSGTNGTQFLGTTDNQPLIIKVNGKQAMRYIYVENISNANSQLRSINVLGGSDLNTISAGVIGATIAGGGYSLLPSQNHSPNRVEADFGTVGGGAGNTAKLFAAVGGGGGNVASNYATVAGGTSNVAGNTYTAVGGGYANMIYGSYSTIAGGFNNMANSAYSFAGGQRAQANHDGSFVWNDASHLNTSFSSTGLNQFLVHAEGGVGINTSDPAGFALHVAGTGKFDGNLTVASLTQTSDARYKTHIAGLGEALNTILGLRGVSYAWDRAKWPTRGFADGRQLGFLAQEVESVLPELVVTDKNGYKSVNYLGVVPVLVEAVRILNNKAEMQQKQIEALRADNAELKRQNARILELEARLNALLSSRK